MLQLKLPGSYNHLRIMIPSSMVHIETVIHDMLFPYASYSNILTNEHAYDISVTPKIICLSISGRLTRSFNYSSEHDAYKILIDIIRNCFHIDDNHLYLHGSVIKHCDKTYLLLAPSCTGKSTLSMYLHTLKNFECITDDLAIIDMNHIQIIPISKYIHIRDNALKLFDANIVDHFSYNNFLGRYQYPLKKYSFDERYNLTAVLLLQRKEGANSIHLDERSQMDILYNCFLPSQVKQNVINSIKLSRCVRTWRLEYETLDQALTLIQSIFDKTYVS